MFFCTIVYVLRVEHMDSASCGLHLILFCVHRCICVASGCRQVLDKTRVHELWRFDFEFSKVACVAQVCVFALAR